MVKGRGRPRLPAVPVQGPSGMFWLLPSPLQLLLSRCPWDKKTAVSGHDFMVGQCSHTPAEEPALELVEAELRDVGCHCQS